MGREVLGYCWGGIKKVKWGLRNYKKGVKVIGEWITTKGPIVKGEWMTRELKNCPIRHTVLDIFWWERGEQGSKAKTNIFIRF